MNMINDSQTNKYIRVLKYFTPILIAILYFQGYAYHAGHLEAYMINELLYPLFYEQVFIQTYFLYATLLSSHTDYCIYTLLLLFVVMLLTSIATANNKQQKEITNKTLIKLNGFFKRHKNAFNIPAILFVLFYGALIVILISIIPYQIGRKQGAERLEKLRQWELCAELAIKCENGISIIPAIILESSDKLVTILTKDNKIQTIPFSEITSITYQLKGSQNQK